MLDFIEPLFGRPHNFGMVAYSIFNDLDIAALWSIKVQMKCCKNSLLNPEEIGDIENNSSLEYFPNNPPPFDTLSGHECKIVPSKISCWQSGKLS